jgi:protein-tyrosine phosphatase
VTSAVSGSRRHFQLERCFNFRDIGAYPGLDGRTVRWRRLFRSMTPEFASPSDLTTLKSLGIRTVIDLRGPRFKTSGPIGEPPVRRVAVGRRRALVPNPRALAEFRALPPEEALPLVLDRMAGSFAQAAALVAESDGPVLFHCRLGKDRTGIMSALLLKLLGVDDSLVLEDYLHSDGSLDQTRALLIESGESPDEFDRQAHVVRAPAQRTVMEAVLRRLAEHYDGAYAYLRAHGVLKRQLEAIIANYLETPPAAPK